jgi:hypothetical protein
MLQDAEVSLGQLDCIPELSGKVEHPVKKLDESPDNHNNTEKRKQLADETHRCYESSSLR